MLMNHDRREQLSVNLRLDKAVVPHREQPNKVVFWDGNGCIIHGQLDVSVSVSTDQESPARVHNAFRNDLEIHSDIPVLSIDWATAFDVT